MKLSPKANTLKQYILLEIPQVDIYAKYLGISTSDIDYCIETNGKIRNPLRDDSNPSLSFRYFGEKLRVKDWADSTYSGDIFDLVGIIIGKNSNRSKDFVGICKHIIITMNSSNYNVRKVNSKEAKKKRISSTKFYVEHSKWQKEDIAFWGEIGIVDLDFLEKEYTKPVKLFYTNDNSDPSYVRKSKDRCYDYIWGKQGDVVRRKLYLPDRDIARFRTNNTNELEFPFTNIFRKSNLIITKSRKDALLINYICTIRNIDLESISFSGESNLLSKGQVDILGGNYDNVIIFVDFDKAGILNSYYHYKVYNIPYFFIGNKLVGYQDITMDDNRYLSRELAKHNIDFDNRDILDFIDRNSANYDVKDISDYSKKYGIEKATSFLMDNLTKLNI